MPPTNPKQQILEAATRLFYEAGIRATGVDRIIAESGVAKATFYRHFPSKADLVAAALAARDAPTRNFFIQKAEARAAAQGIAPALAFFDVLSEWLATPNFNGCPFARAALEMTEDERVRAVAATHKQTLETWMAKSLPGKASRAEAARIARALMLIVDGAIVRAQIESDPAPVARAARAAAEAIMEPK